MAGQELAASTVVRHPDSGEVVILTVGSPLPGWAEGIVDDYLLCPAGTAAGQAAVARQAEVDARRQRRLQAQARAAAEVTGDDPDDIPNGLPGDDLADGPNQGVDDGGGSGKAVPAAPPRAGRGSGTDAWKAYAKGLGLDVPDDAQRDDIVELVDQHNQL